LAWTKGDLSYDPTPAFLNTSGAIGDMVYDFFCGSNLSKYLVEKSKLDGGQADVKTDGISDGKVLVFLKPCDTYSFNQLLSEHRVDREKTHIVGVGCTGMLDIEKVRDKGIKGILNVIEKDETLEVETLYGKKNCEKNDVLLDKCLNCKGKEHKIYDELIGDELSSDTKEADRFVQVVEIENMEPEKRFAYWRGELSKCIRCNACRNICPACSCIKCIFDNVESGVDAKVNITDFEENLFHIIRAYHVAGRCSDCGECSRACPQRIPLHLLNRKFIKDINEFYGEFQAGETKECLSPLLHFEQDDIEPNEIATQGRVN
jgi:ferredoxin